VNEIGDKQMKHVEINGKEIVLAKSGGKFYAFAEICGQMNARLSHGNIDQNVVTCPFHAAKFDITTGNKVREPVFGIPPGMDPLPPSWQKYMEHSGQEMALIKTYNQETYEVKIEGDKIKIKA
jgi:nitrite reductase/ring-hydroxylating ferredoxin subunit